MDWRNGAVNHSHATLTHAGQANYPDAALSTSYDLIYARDEIDMMLVNNEG